MVFPTDKLKYEHESKVPSQAVTRDTFAKNFKACSEMQSAQTGC